METTPNRPAIGQHRKRRLFRILQILVPLMLACISGYYVYSENMREAQLWKARSQASRDYDQLGPRPKCLTTDEDGAPGFRCPTPESQDLWDAAAVEAQQRVWACDFDLRRLEMRPSVTILGMKVYFAISVQAAMVFGTLAFLWTLLHSRLGLLRSTESVLGRLLVVLLALEDAARVAHVCAVPLISTAAFLWTTTQATRPAGIDTSVTSWLGDAGSKRRSRILLVMCVPYVLPGYISKWTQRPLDPTAFESAGNILMSVMAITVLLHFVPESVFDSLGDGSSGNGNDNAGSTLPVAEKTLAQDVKTPEQV